MVKLFGYIAALILLANGVQAQETPQEDTASGNLPRFVSLRSNHINARSGPGARYPIEWVYMQKSAPVEVVAEFELWRKIKDWQGSESWIHKAMLSGKRYVKVITPGENNLYAKDDYKSKIIAKVEDEVIGEINRCPANNDFCQIKFNGYEGWMPRQNLFGVYKDEIID